MARGSVRFAWAAFFCSAVLLSQDFRGTVTGQVTDPSRSGVAGATVTVQNLQTNETQTQTTSDSGNYTIFLQQISQWAFRFRLRQVWSMD